MEKKYTGRIFYGWFILIACWLLIAVVTGLYNNSYNQFLKPMCDHLGISRAEFSISTSIVSVCGIILYPQVGKIFSKIKPSTVVRLSLVTSLIGWFGYSAVNNIVTFYIMSVFLGVGSAFTSGVVTNVLVNNWFHKRKGFAMGFVTTGSGIGSALFNPIGSALTMAYGYQFSMRMLGLIAICCMLPIALLFRYEPSEIGLKPYGLNGEAAAQDDSNKQPVPDYDENCLMKEDALRSPRFWMLSIILFFFAFGAIGIFSQMAAYLTDVGYSAIAAGSIISIISISMAAAKIFFGWLNDRIGTLKNFICIMTLGIAGMFLMLYIDKPGLMIPAAVLFGVAFATTNVMSPIVTVGVTGAKDFTNIFGMVSVAMNLGALIAGPMSGAIFDITGSYRGVYTFYGFSYVAALILGIILLRKKPSEE
ncbi:MAG: MFS transporter [Clostridiales bacterium]|nr:MFS transporter [Candidatus Crickella merdequi]